MIAMSLLSTYDEYCHDRITHAAACSPPAYPVRRALMHVLSMIGLGVGGVAAVDDDEALGIS